MYCNNCGTQLLDGAVFCQNCGTKVVSVQPAAAEETVMNVQPMNQEMVYQNVQPMNQGVAYQNAQPMNQGVAYPNMQPMNQEMAYQNVQQPYGAAYPNPAGHAYAAANLQQANHNKNKKVGIIAFGVMLAIVAVAIFLIINLFQNGKNYKDPIHRFMKGIQNHDIDKMMSAYPKEFRETIGSPLLYYSGDMVWESLESSLEDSVGEGAKISYEIGEAEDYDKEEVEELIEEIDYIYDIELDITAAKEVEVLLELKGSLGEEEETQYVTVVKIGGKWYLLTD